MSRCMLASVRLMFEKIQPTLRSHYLNSSYELTQKKKRRLSQIPEMHLGEAADHSIIPATWRCIEERPTKKKLKRSKEKMTLSTAKDEEDSLWKERNKDRVGWNDAKVLVKSTEGSSELASLATDVQNGVHILSTGMVSSQLGAHNSQSITPGLSEHHKTRASHAEEKYHVEYTALCYSDTSEKGVSSTVSTACTERISPNEHVLASLKGKSSCQRTLETTWTTSSVIHEDLEEKDHEGMEEHLTHFFQSFNGQHDTWPWNFRTKTQNPTIQRRSTLPMDCFKNRNIREHSTQDGPTLRSEIRPPLQQSPLPNDTISSGTEKDDGRLELNGQEEDFGKDIFIDDGYLVTPGKHRIHLNSFLMSGDQEMLEQLRPSQPGLAALTCYAQDIYLEWRSMEKCLDPKVFQLSFKEGSDIEKFRQMAIQCIFMYVRDGDLLLSTAHCSIHNVHRILLYYAQQTETRLTANLFFGTVAACVRMALKHEETPEKTRLLRDASTKLLWKRFGLRDALFAVESEKLTHIEVMCFKILNHPLTPPSGLDYIERYLCVGGWPLALHETYRDIACYLVNLALFSRRSIDHLTGLPPSLIAAASLALGIKVISAGREDGYEFWPQRLVVYSGYTIANLRPAVRGLSALLRCKPPESEILQYFHPVWAKYDWK